MGDSERDSLFFCDKLLFMKSLTILEKLLGALLVLVAVFFIDQQFVVAQTGGYPSAPTNLRLDGTPTASTIPLAWTADTSLGDKFHLYRKLTTDTYWPTMFMTEISYPGTTYIDMTVMPGTTYDYAVEACLFGVGCNPTRSYLIGVSSGGSTSSLPPPTPTSFSGPTSGITGTMIGPFTASLSLSPSQVGEYALYDWGDGMFTSPVYAPSGGATVSASHSWTTAGVYVVRVKAKNSAGLESSWVTMMVTITDPVIQTPSSPALSITTSVSPIALSWSSVSGATYYILQRKITGDATWQTLVSSSPNLTYSDSAVTSGTSYQYQVIACVTTGNCSLPSSTQSVTVQSGSTSVTVQSIELTAPTKPNAPVLAGSSGENFITLTWTETSSGVSGFKVYKMLSGLWTDVGNRTSPYVDSGLNAGTYSYRVQAFVNQGGGQSPIYSDPSNVVDVVVGGTQTTTTTTTGSTTPPSSSSDTTPPAISDVFVQNLASDSAEISFRADEEVVSGVMYGTQSSAGATYSYFSNSSCAISGVTSLNTFCVRLSGLVSGTKYYFRVKAKNTVNLVTTSSEQSFTTLISVSPTPSTTTATPTTSLLTATPTLLPVIVAVQKGSEYCSSALLGMARVTIGISPVSGGLIVLTRDGVSLGSKPAGTYDLTAGKYAWKLEPASGYAISGTSVGSFAITKDCTMATVTTATNTPPATTISTIASSTLSGVPPSNSVNTPYIVLYGRDEIHLALGEEFIDPGAKGYYLTTSNFVLLRGDITNLDVRKPGTYEVAYHLHNSAREVVATKTRTVIVEKLEVPLPLAPTAEPVLASSVQTIASPEAYASFCDDPLRKTECATFSATKIVETEIIPVTHGVSEGAVEDYVAKGALLPGGANTASELDLVCAQVHFAEQCADLAVRLEVASEDVAKRRAEELLSARKEVDTVLDDRKGARIFADTDKDGITDYDELNIYRTDPKSADTNRNGKTDGDEILAGTNPTLFAGAGTDKPISGAGASTTDKSIFLLFAGERVAYENVRLAGETKENILAVTEATGTVKDIPGGATTSSVTLRGRALPNSFVTLYVFSEPIVVTLKTDEYGEWTYTLDKELPDGNHEVYTAITDSGGRVLAKSEPLPFVKVASALTIGTLESGGGGEVHEPGFFEGGSLYATAAILVGVLGIGLTIIAVVARKKRDDEMPLMS